MRTNLSNLKQNNKLYNMRVMKYEIKFSKTMEKASF